MKFACRLWFVCEGKAFGKGPYLLLEGVEKTGSLHQAALKMGMSYRKAWETLRACEKELGLALIERKVGGASGGGSTITPSGRNLIKCYEQFCRQAERAIEKIYQKNLKILVKSQKKSRHEPVVYGFTVRNPSRQKPPSRRHRN